MADTCGAPGSAAPDWPGGARTPRVPPSNVAVGGVPRPPRGGAAPGPPKPLVLLSYWIACPSLIPPPSSSGRKLGDATSGARAARAAPTRGVWARRRGAWVRLLRDPVPGAERLRHQRGVGGGRGGRAAAPESAETRNRARAPAEGAPGLGPAAGLEEPPPPAQVPRSCPAVTCTPDAAKPPQNPAPRSSLRRCPRGCPPAAAGVEHQTRDMGERVFLHPPSDGLGCLGPNTFTYVDIHWCLTWLLAGCSRTGRPTPPHPLLPEALPFICSRFLV